MQREIFVTNSSAYLFMMAALLIGLPLLTAYYNVDSSFYLLALGPYLIASIAITLVLLFLSKKNSGNLLSLSPALGAKGSKGTNALVRFVSAPNYIILSLTGLCIAFFFSIDFIFVSSFPLPPNQSLLTSLGEIYVALLIVASAIGFPKLIYGTFPILRRVLSERKYAAMAVTFAILFALVYLLLVNQVIIAGYNVQATVPVTLTSPLDRYPYAFAMSLGVQNPIYEIVYLPVVIVQLSAGVNFILVPFEVVFTTVISLLVASNVVLAHYLISNSGLRCSTKGTAISTGGSILGLTATCPTCLVPAFVSVIFGGVTAATLIYSNFYGVILPPLVSVASLVISLVYLSRLIRSNTSLVDRSVMTN